MHFSSQNTANTLNIKGDYYPFGSLKPLRHSGSNNYRFSFNGMEVDNEVKGDNNSLDFGARIYDPRIGRFLSIDPAFNEYPSISPYTGLGNNPLVFIDPDGKRLYFVGGAGNDAKGWNYINRFKRIFTQKGIKGFTRINASGGVNKDIAFTATYKNFSHIGNQLVKSGSVLEVKLKRRDHKQIEKAVNDIMIDLQNNPLKEGEQLNLAGYSYGSVLQANVALQLADKGVKVDNLILIGSPISDKSELFKALNSNKNIGKVIRKDIPGDKLSNPQSNWDFFEGGKQNLDPNDKGVGPHFDYARPGTETDRKIGQLGDELKKNGVE